MHQVAVFDVDTRLWVPVTVAGQIPPNMWSHAADTYRTLVSLASPLTRLTEDQMYVFFGCQGQTFYNDVYALMIGVGIQAANCSASGPGLTSGVAGRLSWFVI